MVKAKSVEVQNILKITTLKMLYKSYIGMKNYCSSKAGKKL